MGGTVSLAAASAGARVAWVVPTYKNGRPLWRWASAAAGGVADVNKAERMIDFPGGGFLGIYSADNPDAIRGEAFNLVIVDEAARIDEDTWTGVIQPTLADAGGDAILISTPKGRNWFWREFVNVDGRSSAAWTAPSRDNPNPLIRRAAELARERVPEATYRQEWLAEFLEDGGGVFRRVTEAATATPQERALAGHQYALGVDWGKYQDFTAIAVLDMTARQLAALERFNRIDYRLQTERLKGIAARFRPAVILAERNAMGEPLIEALQYEGLPVVGFATTPQSKGPLIDALALALERADLEIIPDPILLAELQAYEATRLPGGMLRYGAPSGMHDDTVMALALAWYATAVPEDQIVTLDDALEERISPY